MRGRDLVVFLCSIPLTRQPPPFRYSGLLFDVDMDQLAGVSGLDAPDYPAAVAVQIAQATHPVPLEHPVQRRGRDPSPRSQTGGAKLMAPAQLN